MPCLPVFPAHLREDSAHTAQEFQFPFPHLGLAGIAHWPSSAYKAGRFLSFQIRVCLNRLLWVHKLIIFEMKILYLGPNQRLSQGKRQISGPMGEIIVNSHQRQISLVYKELLQFDKRSK